MRYQLNRTRAFFGQSLGIPMEMSAPLPGEQLFGALWVPDPAPDKVGTRLKYWANRRTQEREGQF